ITSLSKTVGPTAGGTTLMITGSGFVMGATVQFGTLAATGVSVDSVTQITCTTPARAEGAVDVQVTTNGQTVTKGAAFTYMNPPVITTLTPNSGSTAGGARVVVAGTGFLPGSTVT